MHWILQNNLFNESAYQELLDTLKRFEIPYSVHKVIPVIGKLTQPRAQPKGRNVICMGSYSMRHVAKRKGWYPGVFDLEPFDFEVQMQHWDQHMLNADAIITKFGEAVLTENEMFLRPIADSKAFAGKVMFKDEFEQWQQKVAVLEFDYGTGLSKETLIQVCKPKKIYSEHRFWVVKGKIVTSSTYKLGHTVIYQALPQDSMFQKYAEERIAEWQPLDAFVIDIADTADGLKVVEINTLNSCGFYACDMQKLVMALHENFSEN